MIRVLGIDTGGTTGLGVLDAFDGVVPSDWYHVEPSQLTGPNVMPVLSSLFNFWRFDLVAIERFVVSKRAGRSATPGGGEAARDIIGAVKALCREQGVPLVTYSASQVKRWATDKRLEAAGLLAPTVGMGHARDATRHALHAAVKHLRLPDPLSTKDRT